MNVLYLTVNWTTQFIRNCKHNHYSYVTASISPPRLSGRKTFSSILSTLVHQNGVQLRPQSVQGDVFCTPEQNKIGDEAVQLVGAWYHPQHLLRPLRLFRMFRCHGYSKPEERNGRTTHINIDMTTAGFKDFSTWYIKQQSKVTPGWCWKCAGRHGLCHGWTVEKRNVH